MDDLGRDVKNAQLTDMLIYDRGRAERIGIPEAVFCFDKQADEIVQVVECLDAATVGPVLFTRLSPEKHEAVSSRTAAALDYDALSQTAFLNGTLDQQEGRVGIVAAGTSDQWVALEAQRTLQFLGISSRLHVDVGVAGLWRLLDRLEELRSEQALIVIAGMDAALASVVGGLVACPIVAVPTSTGYGAAQGGQTALNAMLASCAQGVLVTNIDNGFGAACGVARILSTK